MRDSGVGIEGHMLDRVFDMFTQADRSIDRAQGGVGMGLTLARKIVLQHGGDIWLEPSGRGSGLTVGFTLLKNP